MAEAGGRSQSFPGALAKRLKPVIRGLISLIRRPVRVLFIGNSYTHLNGGVPYHLERLSAWKLRAESVTGDGFSLSHHWQKSLARERIRRGRWDYVVLQEQSKLPVVDYAEFAASVRLFEREIRAAGAKPLLFMTWERPDSVHLGATSAGLQAAYQAMARESGAGLVAVGKAFERSLALRPDILLNDLDGHPTASGTFLAACVFHRVLLGRKPPRHHLRSVILAAETMAHLKAVAEGTLWDVSEDVRL